MVGWGREQEAQERIKAREGLGDATIVRSEEESTEIWKYCFPWGKNTVQSTSMKLDIRVSCVVASLQQTHSNFQTKFLILKRGRKVGFSQGELWGSCLLLELCWGQRHRLIGKGCCYGREQSSPGDQQQE